MRASITDAPALARGGWLVNSVRGATARRGLTIPSLANRDNLPSCSPSLSAVTGSNRAMGRLIRQAGDQIKRLYDLARLGLAAEGALKDPGDLARAIEVAERAVDGEAKVAVAARQG